MEFEEEVFTWLLKTRDSGKYNMITEIARPLQRKFPLALQSELREIYVRWTEDCEKYVKSSS